MADNNLIKKLKDEVNVEELVKDNQGALIGAVVGYLFSDKLQTNKQLESAILGAVAGAILDSKTGKK